MLSRFCKLHFLLEEEAGRDCTDMADALPTGVVCGLVMGEVRGELANSYT